jgi:hypothetical protein
MDVADRHNKGSIDGKPATFDRLSVSSVGRTMHAAAEERAAHVRRAVEILSCNLVEGANEAFSRLFAPRWIREQSSSEPVATRAGWALANMLLLSRFENARHDLKSAEQWFLPGRGHPRLSRFVGDDARHEAEACLDRLTFDDDLDDLLPYVLDAHGPGSRLSVMKDPSTRAAREAKKRGGVFYTPADVAEYIVDTVAGALAPDARFIDPCCGTGVFLVALLRRSKGGLDYLLEHLYGVDTSALSIDCCAFVLLRACRETYKVPPWYAWHLIRMNLFAHDSLRLRDWKCNHQATLADDKRVVREHLLACRSPKPVRIELPETMQTWKAPGHRSIWEVFPEADGGFDAVVGNPPYAQLGKRDDGAALNEYSSLPAYSPSASTYPLFVEMTWRFAKRNNSCSGLVIPLSIAYHQGRQFAACRSAMQKAGGHWRCVFFDREPHALFGEDVKTRNAIIFHSDRGSPDARLSVTPLLKWTSRTRAQLFASICFTDLGNLNFESAMPKLGSATEARAFSKLTRRKARLADLCVRTATCEPCEALKEQTTPRVFVASTAYNFLNVFRPFNGIGRSHPLSENRVHCCEFASECDARLAFAILTSRFAFWLWHTLGDGFHVSRRFLEAIPFNRESFDSATQKQLEGFGGELWESLQSHRIVSLNRGRQTIAFRPLACTDLREQIDTRLVGAANLPADFVDTLRSFVETVVVVDPSDKRRSHLMEFFNRTEDLS